MGGFRQEINDGFSRPNVGQSFILSGISRLDRTAITIRNKHCAAWFPSQVALPANFWQELSSAAPQGGSR
jgi:hypothetical protein